MSMPTPFPRVDKAALGASARLVDAADNLGDTDDPFTVPLVVYSDPDHISPSRSRRLCMCCQLAQVHRIAESARDPVAD